MAATYEEGLLEGARVQRERDVYVLRYEARGLSPLVRSLLLSIAGNIEADVGGAKERPTLPEIGE